MTGASRWIVVGLLIVAGASCGSGTRLTGTGTGEDAAGGRGAAGPSCENMMCDASSFCATATFNGATRLHNCLPRAGCNDCGCMFAIVEAYLEANSSSRVVPTDCHCSPADAGEPISISCNEG